VTALAFGGASAAFAFGGAVASSAHAVAGRLAKHALTNSADRTIPAKRRAASP
jgi:hypothetical protein